jgi:hypothetical protein
MAKTRKRRKRRARPPASPQGARKPRKPVEPAVRRTARDEAPRAPWGSFPLTELSIRVGLVMLVAGFAIAGTRGTLLIAVGISLAALGGLELAIREHFAGYRSHSALLALACAVLSAALGFTLGIVAFGSVIAVIPVAVGALVFIPAFLALRNAFRRASGGLSYRIGRLRG